MKSSEFVVSLAQRAEQALETVFFVAATFVVGGGMIAMCLPGVLGIV